MPPPSAQQQNRLILWRMAGLWLVILAVGLAIIGIVQAVQQAQSYRHGLLSQAEERAAAIAERARAQFEHELPMALRDVSDHRRNHPDGPWQRPRPFPTWIDGLFAWDGQTLETIEPPTASPDALIALTQARMADRHPAEMRQASAGRTELFYDTMDDTNVVLAAFPTGDHLNRPILLVANLDPARMRKDLIEPLLPFGSGLELAPAGQPYQPWSQPLYLAMKFWVIKPSIGFLNDLNRRVFGQTMVYLGLSILSLCTLLAAMWFVLRLARREMALAELKANFVADVSHELKTPLALIRMFGETLHDGRVKSEEKRQEYYGIIIRESTRLTNLINNILDFARIDAGRKEYNFQPIDVGDVARETWEAYLPQLEHGGFTHQLHIEPDLPVIEGDRDAMAQAIVNLISNAVKYSDDEKHIDLEITRDTRRGRHGVLISIHDRGLGIRPEDRAHLTEGFFRAADNRVRQRGGTGLGLALVRHIVDAHDGSIDVESRLVKGSTFRIFFPARDTTPAAHNVAARANAAAPPVEPAATAPPSNSGDQSS